MFIYQSCWGVAAKMIFSQSYSTLPITIIEIEKECAAGAQQPKYFQQILFYNFHRAEVEIVESVNKSKLLLWQ